MHRTTVRRFSDLEPELRPGPWLRFKPDIAERYEREHGQHRIAHLRFVICVGLVWYNTYNLTSFVLLPDILGWTIAGRLGLMTPISLLLAWGIGYVGGTLREWLILGGMILAYLLPLLFFACSHAPLSGFTFIELLLTICVGNMLLALRFRHAALFTGVAVVATLAALAAKTGLGTGLRVALGVQLINGCTFTLYGNYLLEKRRCLDYLVALSARLRSNEAEVARRRFEDIAYTDALTGLPNRRPFHQWLDNWHRGSGTSQSATGALLMIDVDYFKVFNDQLGHPAGDHCLVVLAGIFRQVADQAGARCARLGGEEFAVVLTGAQAVRARRLARNLQQAVLARAIRHPGRDDGLSVVTISLGIAISDSGEPSAPSDLLAAADAALYQAKRRGRNCIRTATAGGQ